MSWLATTQGPAVYSTILWIAFMMKPRKITRNWGAMITVSVSTTHAQRWGRQRRCITDSMFSSFAIRSLDRLFLSGVFYSPFSLNVKIGRQRGGGVPLGLMDFHLLRSNLADSPSCHNLAHPIPYSDFSFSLFYFLPMRLINNEEEKGEEEEEEKKKKKTTYKRFTADQ